MPNEQIPIFERSLVPTSWSRNVSRTCPAAPAGVSYDGVYGRPHILVRKVTHTQTDQKTKYLRIISYILFYRASCLTDMTYITNKLERE